MIKKKKFQIVEFGPFWPIWLLRYNVISETIHISDSVHPLTFYCKVLTQSIVRKLEIHLSLHRSPGYLYYRIKRFFSGDHACAHSANALINWINCECIGTVYTCMNSWKEPFNPYNSSMQYWTYSCNAYPWSKKHTN